MHEYEIRQLVILQPLPTLADFMTKKIYNTCSSTCMFIEILAGDRSCDFVYLEEGVGSESFSVYNQRE